MSRSYSAIIRGLYLALGVCLLLAASPVGADAKPGYYIEFRARMGTLVGHGFVVIGKETAHGDRKRLHHLGFFADGGAKEYIMSVFGVRGATGPLSLDKTSPTLEKFSLPITHAQYQKLMASVRQWKSRPRMFNVFSSNCNFFVARMARTIGLKAPKDYARLPPEYLSNLRALNVRRVAHAH